MKKSFNAFVRGVARLADPCGTLNRKYNFQRRATSRKADFEAMKFDWEQVGKHLQSALDKWGEGRR